MGSLAQYSVCESHSYICIWQCLIHLHWSVEFLVCLHCNLFIVFPADRHLGFQFTAITNNASENILVHAFWRYVYTYFCWIQGQTFVDQLGTYPSFLRFLIQRKYILIPNKQCINGFAKCYHFWWVSILYLEANFNKWTTSDYMCCQKRNKLTICVAVL